MLVLLVLNWRILLLETWIYFKANKMIFWCWVRIFKNKIDQNRLLPSITKFDTLNQIQGQNLGTYLLPSTSSVLHNPPINQPSRDKSGQFYLSYQAPAPLLHYTISCMLPNSGSEAARKLQSCNSTQIISKK